VPRLQSVAVKLQLLQSADECSVVKLALVMCGIDIFISDWFRKTQIWFGMSLVRFGSHIIVTKLT